jgi:prolipoprotein diacylglyceryltransferase
MNFFSNFDFDKNIMTIHYLFETLAFVIGIRIYYYKKKKITDIISDENRLWILLGAMVGALIGSRLVAVLESPQYLSQVTLMTLYQSKTVAGGFLGGLFGVEIVKKIIKVNIASGDLYVVPIIIAVFVGRIGCFLSGVNEPTFGNETTFFTGMNLGDGLKRHPTALYEMIYMDSLLVFFHLIKNKKMINGDRFKLFMILYFMYRFSIEFIKPYESLCLYLSSIQWSAIFIFVYYYKFIIRILKFEKS